MSQTTNAHFVGRNRSHPVFRRNPSVALTLALQEAEFMLAMALARVLAIATHVHRFVTRPDSCGSWPRSPWAIAAMPACRSRKRFPKLQCRLDAGGQIASSLTRDLGSRPYAMWWIKAA